MRNSQACKYLCEFLIRQEKVDNPEALSRTVTLLKVMLNYSSANQKEKVHANAVRALGFFLANYDLAFFKSVVIPFANQRPALLKSFCDEALSSDKLCFQQSVQTVLIRSLKSTSPKITWNACVAIGRTVQQA